jgi:O-acetyl-ADP-ribose deacetylase (regulator of RNase III)
MKSITGDLLQMALDGRFDVIIHGCNCQCAMGKGIALSIKNQFPEAYAEDLKTTKADRAKLGTITVAQVERDKARFSIVNAYTQFHYRGDGVLADYDAIRSAFKRVKEQFSGRRIGYPKIGAGLAKGDWKVISAIIDEELADEDHTLVEFVAATDQRH